MINLKHTRNPYILFLPFLLLFFTIVIVFHDDKLMFDEGGYMFFASNLLKGYYSPPPPDINLWWGPGYPLFLAPFLASGLPQICITLMNAIFSYLSIVLLFKAMVEFIDFKKALFFSLFWAFCYSTYKNIPKILSEPIAIFLVSLLVLLIVYAFSRKDKKYIYLAGIILGYLALTKVIFGYVLLCLLIGSLGCWVLNRKGQNYKKATLITAIAFAVTLPYLVYTYNLTGKLFYWGNSGGMSLYWITTPFENEYGDWNSETFDGNKIGGDDPARTSNLKENHQDNIQQVQQYRGAEKDGMYKKIAKENIKSHPVKFAKNLVSNISRLMFGFPYSYTYQHPLFKIWYFAILYGMMVLSAILTILNWRKIDFPVRFLFIMAVIYFAGTSMLAVYNRMFLVIVPVFLFWIAYIIHKTTIIKLKFDPTELNNNGSFKP